MHSSIFWLPTEASQLLWLGVNLSDHVHYYHGGKPFHYVLVDPKVREESTQGVLAIHGIATNAPHPTTLYTDGSGR